MTLSATSLIGTKVRNTTGQNLGHIEDLVIDLTSGEVCYAVLSFSGIMDFGDKYFAVPLQVLELDTTNKECVLNEPKPRLQEAPGFDKNDWPKDIDDAWLNIVRRYYRLTQ